MNCNNKDPKIRGFSLLEVLLFLTVASVILLAAVNRYSKSTLNTQTVQVKNSIQLLTGALDSYYFANCSTLAGNKTTIPLRKLSPDYLPDSTPIQNPFNPKAGIRGVQSYTLTVDATGTSSDTPWTLSISLNFPQSLTSSQFSTIASLLGPQFQNFPKRVMTWQHSPSLSRQGTATLTKSKLEDFTIREYYPGAQPNQHTQTPCISLEYNTRHPREVGHSRHL
jgi:type II secretory pathway pseudopilin PulG